MLLLFAFLAATSPSPAPVKVVERARASVTILRAHSASRESWDPAKKANQRETVKKEPDGAEVRLRLTEFE